MSIKSSNKDKSMFYISMKNITNYDSRWLKGNIQKYCTYDIKRPEDREYCKKKSIIKYYQVEYEE